MRILSGFESCLGFNRLDRLDYDKILKIRTNQASVRTHLKPFLCRMFDVQESR